MSYTLYLKNGTYVEISNVKAFTRQTDSQPDAVFSEMITFESQDNRIVGWIDSREVSAIVQTSAVLRAGNIK